MRVLVEYNSYSGRWYVKTVAGPWWKPWLPGSRTIADGVTREEALQKAKRLAEMGRIDRGEIVSL